MHCYIILHHYMPHTCNLSLSLSLSLCLQTKGRVDDFKELQGLIAALFNPGLRDRHWQKMSDIVGQDLRPAEVGGLPLSSSSTVHLSSLYLFPPPALSSSSNIHPPFTFSPSQIGRASGRERV